MKGQVHVELAIGIVFLLIQLFLYFNATAIYGAYASQVQSVLLAYFVLLAMFSPFVLTELTSLKPDSLAGFAIMFVLTAVVLLGVESLTGFIASSVEGGLTLAFGFGFLHAFVKAFDEEIIFRGVLPKLMGGNIYADGISAVIFGVFHLAVTGASIPSMFLLMGLGFTWSLIYRYFKNNIFASTGSHFAWNLAALGILSKII